MVMEELIQPMVLEPYAIIFHNAGSAKNESNNTMLRHAVMTASEKLPMEMKLLVGYKKKIECDELA